MPMRPTKISFLCVLLTCLSILAPLGEGHAAQARRSGRSRSVQREGRLAPKVDYELDADVGMTKKWGVDVNLGRGPGISLNSLTQAQTEALLDNKIDEEIELADHLLQFENECDSAAPVRFRLADLYWEKSKRSFFKSNDAALPAVQRQAFLADMQHLQNATINSYQRLITDCPDYTDLPKALYFLGKAYVELDRAKDAAAYFKQIIKEYPQSEWVAYAWFMIGEYYFNTANDAIAALKAYKKATEYQNSPMYAFALYKEGWCYINVAEWQLAMQRFSDVVKATADEKLPMEERGRITLRREALKDFVRAYSNVGDPDNAMVVFDRLGGPGEAVGMTENLGNWYISQGAHKSVVNVYGQLIKHDHSGVRTAGYQGRIVDAASRMGNFRETVRQVKLLTGAFADMRERLTRGDFAALEQDKLAKDIKNSEEIAENTLRRLALEFHKDAKKIRGVAQEQGLRTALEIYKAYLDIFPKPQPDAEVNYVFFMRFYYAEILYKLEDFGEAAANYSQIVLDNPHPKDQREKEIVLAAAEEAVRAYDELVDDLDRQSPPVIDGTEAKDIPKIKQELIAACKRYIETVGEVGEKIVEIRYKMARIYYTYNHFKEAAPAFDDIVANHSEHAVACYAANLALDIYNGAKDYTKLKAASRSYLNNEKLACGAEDRRRFSQIEEQSAFRLIQLTYEEPKKYIEAGNMYLQFSKEYPSSEWADDAIYNAAVNFDHGNKLDKANEVRAFLVEKIPDSPLVPETLYNIAQSYERIVDFDNAAKYLELFAERYPQDKRSKDAIYNAALYRATLRDFDGAWRGRQRFIATYPDDDDVADVALAKCETAELANRLAAERHLPLSRPWSEVAECYTALEKNKLFAQADADLQCYALSRHAHVLSDELKQEKAAAELSRNILKYTPLIKRSGLAKMPRCASAVAQVQFQDLDGQFQRYLKLVISELNPTKKGKKEFDASIKAKTTERDRLVVAYRSIVELGQAEWALASLYQIGAAYVDSIDKLLAAPIPDKIPGYTLNDEDKQLLREQLKQLATPIESLAIEAFRLCSDKANELGVYNKWPIRALDALQKLRPQEYPLAVDRLAEVNIREPLRVLHNGVVLADGEELKAFRGVLRAEANAPIAVPSKDIVAPVRSGASK